MSTNLVYWGNCGGCFGTFSGSAPTPRSDPQPDFGCFCACCRSQPLGGGHTSSKGWAGACSEGAAPPPLPPPPPPPIQPPPAATVAAERSDSRCRWADRTKPVAKQGRHSHSSAFHDTLTEAHPVSKASHWRATLSGALQSGGETLQQRGRRCHRRHRQ